MGHDRVEVLCNAKVSSNVPAAPWDPTTLAARSRAAQAAPAGTDEVVVDEVDVLPGDAVVAVVGVPAFGDEHAARPTTPNAAVATMSGRTRRVAPAVIHRRTRCRAEVLRS
jgi:hypothetical protein